MVRKTNTAAMAVIESQDALTCGLEVVSPVEHTIDHVDADASDVDSASEGAAENDTDRTDAIVPIDSSAPAAKSTKTARLLALLQRADGASIEDLSSELGWQQHTTRAALTGLRKKGHEVSKAKEGSVTIYRVAA
jgi:biotin operon repressor